MKLPNKTSIFSILLISIAILAKGQETENVTLRINNVVGNSPLILNDKTYTNSSGEKFTITTINYFISNIKLKRKDGTDYTVPQDSSYFLIKEIDSTSKSIHLRVPEGTYTAVNFIVGVDSLRSTTDLSHRTGALDISGGMLDGMYWTWNIGYIFFKLEGICEQAKIDNTGQKKFRYHIGGFGGYNKPSINNIKEVTIDLGEHGLIDAQQNKHITVNLNADLLKAFDGKTQMSIAQDPNVMFGVQSKSVAANYSTMFSHVSTKTD
jgi:hypothetical protein